MHPDPTHNTQSLAGSFLFRVICSSVLTAVPFDSVPWCREGPPRSQAGLPAPEDSAASGSAEQARAPCPSALGLRPHLPRRAELVQRTLWTWAGLSLRNATSASPSQVALDVFHKLFASQLLQFENENDDYNST